MGSQIVGYHWATEQQRPFSDERLQMVLKPGKTVQRKQSFKKKNPEIYNKYLTPGNQTGALGEVQVEHKHLDNYLLH